MKKRRRNYVIKKSFQFGFSLKFVLLLLLESLLILGLFMYLSTDTLTTGFQNSILTVKSTQSFFLIQFLLVTLIIVVGISLAGMVIFVLLSHRIAGPLYRFEQTLKDIGAGDLTANIHLRKKDQLTEMQKQLNHFVSAFDHRIGLIKKELNDLEALVSKDNDVQTTSQIKEKINTIKLEIAHFKVSADINKDV